MTRKPGHLTTSVIAAIVVASTIPALAMAHAAWITGASANADWTQGRVDNMALVMDDCGSLPCQWKAVAGVMPMNRGNCPSDWAAGPANGFSTFWESDYQFDNGPVHSGAQQFALDGTVGQRVCLYLERSFPDGSRSTSRWSSRQLQGPSAPPSADEPPPTGDPAAAELTRKRAKLEAKQALKRRFGRKFTRGELRRLRCVTRQTSEFECAVAWTYKQRKYTGDVLVTSSAGGQIATDLEIHRQRLHGD